MLCHCWRSIYPHTKQCNPREELNHTELQHCFWHIHKVTEHICEFSFLLYRFFRLKFCQLFWRIFFCMCHCPQYCDNQHRSSYIERVHQVQWHSRSRCCIAQTKPIQHHVWQPRTYHGAHANQECLHRESYCRLLIWQHICHQRTEWLHCHVDTCIHHHQKACADKHCWQEGREHACIWHQNERNGSQNCTHQEVRTTTTQSTPCLVAIMTNNRLHNHTCQWSHNPEPRKMLNISTVRLQYTTRISILQRKTHLNTQKSHTHRQDLSET